MRLGPAVQAEYLNRHRLHVVVFSKFLFEISVAVSQLPPQTCLGITPVPLPSSPFLHHCFFTELDFRFAVLHHQRRSALVSCHRHRHLGRPEFRLRARRPSATAASPTGHEFRISDFGFRISGIGAPSSAVVNAPEIPGVKRGAKPRRPLVRDARSRTPPGTRHNWPSNAHSGRRTRPRSTDCAARRDTGHARPA